jgi:hypothetical protein
MASRVRKPTGVYIAVRFHPSPDSADRNAQERTRQYFIEHPPQPTGTKSQPLGTITTPYRKTRKKGGLYNPPPYNRGGRV